MSIRLFFSYARNDHEPFVARLYAALKAAGFDVWFDRVSMPSRQLTFHQEIRDAVAACDRLVLVVGPGAVASDYVTQEWRFAYFEAVKCVNPIVRLDSVDAAGEKIDAYNLIPEDLRLIHAEDFRDDAQFDAHLANLIRQLSDPLPPAGKLVAVPELPPHYLDQPARVAALRDILLTDLQKPVVVSGAAARLGLQGMGGIGKSVLASALAHRPEVRRAFPDGVYWVTLGQEPNVADLQRGLARTLGDNELFSGVEAGKEKLRELLGGRAALLVLDDVWQRGHAEAFNVLGPRGRLLLTTRDAGLVTALAAKENHYQVQLPTDIEAEALLAKAAGVPMAELPVQARNVADECGRLPLALALCGGMVHGGRTWQDVLEALREHDLEYLSDSHPAEEQHRSIWKAMDVSIRALSEDERERFAELAVFALDTGAPEAAVETLWGHTVGLNPRHARDLLMNFRQRSLVDFDQSTRRMTMHDLLHNFATGVATKRFGSLAALHRRLLDAYQTKCSSGWHTGPNDGYFLGHLRDHLAAVGEVEELVNIAISLSWLETKANAGMVFDLRFDLDAAVRALPPDEPRRRLVRLMEQALSHDINFIARHPTTLFQCLWNLCWWYDCDESKDFYDAPDGGWGPVGPPWNQREPKVSTLLERWRAEKEASHPDFVWLRMVLPLPSPLGSYQLLRISGHEEDVNSVAIFPDASRIISGSSDRTIRVWDAQSGREMACLRGHEGDVNSVAIFPDASRIISGSSDRTIRVWDAHSGTELACLRGHGGDVTSVVISPDAARIVSGSSDRTIRIWDAQSGGELACLRGHEGDVNSVAIFPDAMRIVSASSDRTIRVWDAQSGSELACFRGHERDVNSVAISPDAARIVSGSSDHTIRVWDAQSDRELACLRGHEGDVNSVAISPNGTRIVSGAQETTLRVWDLDMGNELACVEGHEWRVHCVAISPHGDYIVSGSRDRTVRLWVTEPPKNVAQARLKGQRECKIRCVGISPSGLVFAGGAFWDNSIWVWDAVTGREVARVAGPEVGNANRIEFGRNGANMFVEFSEDTLIYSMSTFTRLDAIPHLISALGLDLAKPPDNRLTARQRGTETVIENVNTHREVTWLATPLEDIAAHHSGRRWAGSAYEGKYLAIIALEGPVNLPFAEDGF